MNANKINWMWIMTVLGLVSAPSLFGQVTRNLGILPPGGSVTITFDVSINTPFPANTAFVTNQGSLSVTGLGSIFTDDPATSSPNDPTVTPLTVAPQIVCPADIVTNAFGSCPQTVPFGVTVNAGVPAPVVTYRIGPTVISSPYAFSVGTNRISVTATNGTAPNASCSFNVVVLPGPAPQLNVNLTGNAAVIWWTNNVPCYSLQYATALGVPPAITTWAPYAGPLTFISGNLYVTNNLAATNAFFRLSY